MQRPRSKGSFKGPLRLLQVFVQIVNALKMYLLSLLDYSAYGRSTMV